jgi:hypothetical protein
MKKITMLNKTRKQLFLLVMLNFSVAGLLSCNGASENSKGKTEDSVAKDTPVAHQQESKSSGAKVHPPVSFVKDLKKKASDVVEVQFIRVDSVYNSMKIFRTKVIKTYKGKLKEGELLSYVGMSERQYGASPKDTITAFLYKSEKPLKNFVDKNLYYSTVEENGQMPSSRFLDSLLKKK